MTRLRHQLTIYGFYMVNLFVCAFALALLNIGFSSLIVSDDLLTQLIHLSLTLALGLTMLAGVVAVVEQREPVAFFYPFHHLMRLLALVWR